MGLNNTDRNALIDIYLERCLNTLRDADTAISFGRWNMAANRIYYSVFYAVSALFIKDGNPIKSHRGAKAVLNKEYVLKGKIDKEDARFFAQLETLRDKADYNVIFEASKEEIMEHRPKVDDFIATIKKMLE